MSVLTDCPSCGHAKHIGVDCPVITGTEPDLFVLCACKAAQSAKADTGKHQGYSMIPWDAIGELADIYSYGAKKYARDSWRQVPDAVERYGDALIRHLGAYFDGEMRDRESGHRHLAHALWNSPRSERMKSLVELAQARRAAETRALPPDPGPDFRFCKCGCGRRINLKMDGARGRPNSTGYSGYCPEIKNEYRRRRRAAERRASGT